MEKLLHELLNRFDGMENQLKRLDTIENQIGQVNHRLDKMDLRFEQIDHRFEQIDHRFEQIDHRFEQIDQRFEQIDHRFEQVDNRFEQIDHRFEQVDNRFEQMTTQFNNQLDTLADSVFIINTKQDEMGTRLDKMIEDQNEMRKEIAFYYSSMMRGQEDTRIELRSSFKHLEDVTKSHQFAIESIADEKKSEYRKK